VASDSALPAGVPLWHGAPWRVPERPRRSLRAACLAVLDRAVAAARRAPGGGVVLAQACEAGYGPACAEAARSPGKDGGARSALRERACYDSPVRDCSRRGFALSVGAGALELNARAPAPNGGTHPQTVSAMIAVLLLVRGEVLEAGAAFDGGPFASSAAGLVGVAIDGAGGRVRLDLLAEGGVANVELLDDAISNREPVADGTLPFFGLRAGLAFGSGGLRPGVWLSLKRVFGSMHPTALARQGTSVDWDHTVKSAGLRLDYEF
jgi:hypothetical protein